MKKIILVASILAGIMITGCSMTRETSSIETVDHNPDPTFRDLNHYGTWVKIPNYGSVWKPFVADNFWLPYADGQWVLTDQGWMWDSNEPYGWIVYHYGYWQFTDYDGWFWMPGYDWAPERVNWYNSDGYIGWAPVPPPNVKQSLIYNDKYARRIWVVVREQDFAGQNIKNFFDRTFVPGASVLHASNVGHAPDKGNIELASNRTINVVQTTRELVGNSNRQLIKVLVQNNTQVNPSTINNQSDQENSSTSEDQSGTILYPDDSDTSVENPTVEDNPPIEVIPPVSEPDNPIVVPDSGPIKHHRHHYKTGLWVNGPIKDRKPILIDNPAPTRPARPTKPVMNPSPVEPTKPVRNPSPVRPTMPDRNPSPVRPAVPTRTSAPTRTPVSTGTSAPTRNPVQTGTSSPTRTPAPSRNPAPIKTAAPAPAPVKSNDNNSVKKDEKR